MPEPTETGVEQQLPELDRAHLGEIESDMAEVAEQIGVLMGRWRLLSLEGRKYISSCQPTEETLFGSPTSTRDITFIRFRTRTEQELRNNLKGKPS